MLEEKLKNKYIYKYTGLKTNNSIKSSIYYK